jgi:phosphoglycolate phosphatase
MPPPCSLLILWDIDHTLIETRGVGSAVFSRAFSKATGRALHEFDIVAGRTELGIVHDCLRLNDIEPTNEVVGRMIAALADAYRESVGELIIQGRVLPGVRAALAALDSTPGVWQSLLTGNTAEVARIKLATFGLDQWLDLTIGAYGDDRQDRIELVPIAKSRAVARLDSPLPSDRIVVIGDTPSDVTAARTAGIHCVAVATGPYSAQELTDAGASIVLPNLAVLDDLLQALRIPD